MSNFRTLCTLLTMAKQENIIANRLHRMFQNLKNTNANIDQLRVLVKKERCKDLHQLTKKLRKCSSSAAKKLCTAMASVTDKKSKRSLSLVITRLEEGGRLAVTSQIFYGLRLLKSSVAFIRKCCRKGNFKALSKLMRKVAHDLKHGQRLCNSIMNFCSQNDRLTNTYQQRLDREVQVTVDDRMAENAACSICLTDPKCVALAPCGHVFCKSCSSRCRKCHLCRENVKSRLPLFYN